MSDIHNGCVEIDENGAFTGVYQEKYISKNQYDDETYYICKYTGSLCPQGQITETIYTIGISELSYPAPAAEYEENGIHYVTYIPRGLEDGNELQVFLPGCNKSDVLEDALLRFGGIMDSVLLFADDRLITYAIYNEKAESGFVFWE